MPIANTDDLTGLGFSAQDSELLGAPVAKINGAGATLQSAAAVILSRAAELNPAAVTTNSFVIPSTAKVMNPYFLTNQQGTNTAYVFVPSGHTLNGNANGSITIATGASAIIWQYKPKNWTNK
jgi:hypothetical protein